LGGEKIWHESQKTAKFQDGTMEITFRVAGLDEIKRWVLSLGPECQVLVPEKLKKWFAGICKKRWNSIQNLSFPPML